MSEEIKKLILEVLEVGHLMSLATADEGGVWVSDVISCEELFGFTKQKLVIN
jgi:hypothetical protein